MKYLLIFLTIIASPKLSLAASASPGPLFTYEGVLTNSDGIPFQSTQIVNFQILQNGGTALPCVLFEETQTITSGANGEFSVVVGTGTRLDDTGNTSDRIFAFGGTINCAGPLGSSTPTTVSGYSPRSLRIKVGSVVLSPDVLIGNIPVAVNAMKLADRDINELVQKNDVPICNTGEYLRHIAPSGTFMCEAITLSLGSLATKSNVDLTADVVGVLPIVKGGTGGSTQAAAANAILPPQAGQSGSFLTTDGANTMWATIPSGGVTNVIAAPTSGNPIIIGGSPANPSIDIPAASASSNGYLKSADWNTFSNKQQANSELTSLSNLTGMGFISRNGSGSHSVKAASTMEVGNTLSLRDGTGMSRFTAVSITNGVGGVILQSPLGVNNYALTLPGNQGTAGQLLSVDAIGNLVWANQSSGTITGVTASSGLVGGGTSGSVSLALAPIASNSLLANTSAIAASPTATTLSALLDGMTAANPGDILTRDAMEWKSTSILPVTSGGTGSNNGSIMGSETLDLSAGGAGDLRLNASTGGAIRLNGKVGVGTVSAPASKLEVNGAITNSVVTFNGNFTCGADAIDFSLGNFIRFSPSSISTTAGTCIVNISNLVPGGSYTLIVTGNATVASVQFNFTNSLNPNFKYLPGNAPTTAGKDSIYTFLYDGVTVYVTWSGGY